MTYIRHTYITRAQLNPARIIKMENKNKTLDELQAQLDKIYAEYIERGSDGMSLRYSERKGFFVEPDICEWDQDCLYATEMSGLLQMSEPGICAQMMLDSIRDYQENLNDY